MRVNSQHLAWSGVVLSACLMVAYGVWVVLVSARGRALSLGEFLLGILALVAGSVILCCLLRIFYEYVALSMKKRRARTAPPRPPARL